MVDKKQIQQAITTAESLTTGEIHVHLCKHVHEDDALAEAQAIFNKYHLANTADRNAILIFVALLSKRFAILGDVAIHQKMGQGCWDRVRDVMASEFCQGHETEALLAAIRLCGEYLNLHFPAEPGASHHVCDDISEDDSSGSA